MREEENQNSKSNGSKWQRSLRKKWVFPAIYIASAAVILTGVLWMQAGDDSQVEAPDSEYSYDAPTDNNGQVKYDQEAIEVTMTKENVNMPVHDGQGVIVQKPFYDYDASTEDQEAALVFYNNTYYPNTGVDYALETGESFDVLASLSGTVVQVENDSLLGQTLKIEHDNGIATHYSSLGEVFVEAGQRVDQGTVIGSAGRSEFNKDAGVHAHFEIRKNDEPVNPIDYINQPLSSLFEGEEEAEQEEASPSSDVEEEEQPAEPSNEEVPKEQPEQPANGEEAENDASVSMTRA